MRRPAWVVMSCLVLLFLAVATAFPTFHPLSLRSTVPDPATSQTVSLGLNHQGGAHLLLAVDREDFGQTRLENLRETLAAEISARNLDPGLIEDEGVAPSVPVDHALFATLHRAAAASGLPGGPPDVARTPHS